MIHTSVPPRRAAASPPAPLRLAFAHRQEFDRSARFDDQDRELFSDLATSCGFAVDEDVFDAGRTTYASMISALLPALAPYDDGFDLALLAHATPDAGHGRPMSRLARSTTRTGLAFALSDQGATSAFTALELAASGTVVDGGRRALVVVAEQSAVFPHGPVPEPLRVRRDTAVALVLDVSGELGGLSCEHRSGVGPGMVSSLVTAYLADASDGAVRPLLIAGAGLAGHRDGMPGSAELRTAPPGMPCAGIWSVLIDELPRLNRRRRTVVLADYDERFGYLGLCRVDAAAQERRTGAAGGAGGQSHEGGRRS